MVVGEVQLLQADEPPGDDGGERRQAVGGEVKLGDLAGDVKDPVEVHPGQPKVGPFYTERLGWDSKGTAREDGESGPGIKGSCQAVHPPSPAGALS